VIDASATSGVVGRLDGPGQRHPRRGRTELSSGSTTRHKVLYLLLVPVLTLIAWEATVLLNVTPPYLLPSPYSVLIQTLPKELLHGRMLLDTAESLRRVVLGVALATLTGVPIGIALGYWRQASEWTSTVVNAGRVIPPASLIPLAVIWFGIGDAPALFLIWFTCVWPILLNASVGVVTVEKIYRDGALTLGANLRQIIATVLLPSALPQIVTGIRLAVGLGWSVVMTSELLAVRNGLGFYIWNARLMFSMEQVLAGIVVIGAIGIVLDSVLRRIQKRMFRWQRAVIVKT
jgi:NitT/TauT family transport system permease protein